MIDGKLFIAKGGLDFMRGKTVIKLAGLTSLLLSVSVNALDSGPKSIGCDFRFGKNEGTAQCLIVGSGMNQGIEWIVFEVDQKRFKYESAAPDRIELVNRANNTIKTYSVRNNRDQCRPGGVEADVYLFKNGDRVCLYW